MKYKMAAELTTSLFEENVAFDVLKRDSKLVIDYTEEQKKIMDAHMVEFFTLNHWETLLSPKMSQELESISSEDLTLLPSVGRDKSESFGLENLGLELKSFILKARSAQLKTFPWVRDRRDFLSYSQQGFISHIMTPKKSYEVEMMSSVVNTLAKRFQVNKILDLGSGKGYLSQYLAMQYGLRVIGIDSSDSNTQNAIKRNERILKAWEGLKKKCSKEKMNGIKPGEPSGASSQTHDQWTVEGTRHFVLFEQDEPEFGENIEGGYKRIDNPVENNMSVQARCTCRCSGTHLLSAKGCLHLTQIPERSSQISAEQSNVNSTSQHFCQICHNKYFDTKAPSTSVDFIETCRQRSTVSHMASGSVNTVIPRTGETQSSKMSSFLPITGFVDHSFINNGELAGLFRKFNFSTKCDSENNDLFLVGLHTCGDLAPVALRIFVQEPCVKLLCIVGCCYHTVTQEFGSGDIAGDPGFPMSELFRQFKLQLSRNATMVAQQAAERIASEAKLPPPSVLHRAILQVILKEKYHLDCRGIHVGRIGAKCKDFNEYLRKSLNKLGLENEVLSDGDIEAYFERFRIKERQLLAFHQLRATIAPCIESVFLLDRLCYLYEQNTKWACIVKLFDPVKSPRCYAIVASKS